MAKKTTKSETLTIRLDPKVRFQLQFMARLKGQSLTTVVERAIAEAANRTGFQNEYQQENTWRDFWDVNEGVRELRIAGEPELMPTYEEEERLKFALTHWQFFYTAPSCGDPREAYISVLWPRIDEFIELHKETLSTDFFAAGKAMQKVLNEANLKEPSWPVNSSPTQRGFGKSGGFDDMDDSDIPF